MILNPLTSRLFGLLTVMTFLIAASADANAQDPRRGYGVGVAGFGTDMWTQAMSGLRLFTPHRDDCNATTEVFVKVYENSNSVDFGFCIEKDQRAAQEWEDAKHACLQDGKRLPEPAEFKYACDSVSGLNNMTDGYEWITNFGKFENYRTGSSGTNYRGILIAAGGNGACYRSAFGSAMHSTITAASVAFRCVR